MFSVVKKAQKKMFKHVLCLLHLMRGTERVREKKLFHKMLELLLFRYFSIYERKNFSNHVYAQEKKRNLIGYTFTRNSNHSKRYRWVIWLKNISLSVRASSMIAVSEIEKMNKIIAKPKIAFINNEKEKIYAKSSLNLKYLFAVWLHSAFGRQWHKFVQFCFSFWCTKFLPQNRS